MAKILSFSGSCRAESFNQKTADCMTRLLQQSGDQITDINLGDYEQPIYHGDQEASDGLPGASKKIKTLISEHDALVIGCPEYNGYMAPVLLNTINWATRSAEASPDLSAFRDKSVLVVSASPGPLGGIRAASHLRSMLAGIGCIIFPDNFMVTNAYAAFNENGELQDENLQQRAEQVAARFSAFCNKLNG